MKALKIWLNFLGIFQNKLEDSKKKRPKLQLNALIPSTSTYYYYEYKNNLVLFFDTSTISLNMNGGGILTASKWGQTFRISPFI